MNEGIVRYTMISIEDSSIYDMRAVMFGLYYSDPGRPLPYVNELAWRQTSLATRWAALNATQQYNQRLLGVALTGKGAVGDVTLDREVSKIVNRYQGSTLIVGLKEDPEHGDSSNGDDDTRVWIIPEYPSVDRGIIFAYANAPAIASPNDAQIFQLRDTTVQITLNWADTASGLGNLNYRVQISKSSSFSADVHTEVVDGHTIPLWFDAQMLGTWYWRVQVRNKTFDDFTANGIADYTSEWSRVSSFRVEQPRYVVALSVSPNNSGTIEVEPRPGGDGKYGHGTMLSLHASPAPHYTFKHWNVERFGDVRDNPLSWKVIGPETMTAVFDASPPGPPGNVSASDGTYGDRVRVTWNSPLGATGYEVWRHTSNNSASASKLADDDASPYDDTTATPGVTYWYWVKAKNTAGTSGFSAGDSGVSAVTPPDPPTGVSASDGTYTDRVRVTWTAGNRATTHEIWRHTSNNAASASKLAEDDASPYDDTTATPGVTYWYWVKARNTAGTSGFSIGDSGYRAVPPDPPTGVSASDGTYTDRVRVTWTAGNRATTHEVWRHTSNNSASASKLADDDASPYDDTTATPGVTYWYWVKAKNTAGTSGFSAGDSGVSAVTPPDPPTGVSASDGTYTDRVRVTWTAGNRATTHEIWRHTSNNAASASKLAEDDASPYDDTTATPGVTYWYWVKAKNPGGTSGPSAGDPGWVGVPLPRLPTDVSASDGIYADRVRVTWTPGNGATTHELWRHTNNNPGSATRIADSASSPYDDAAVVRGVTYWYWVKAKNAGGTSATSLPDSGYPMTLPSIIAPPRGGPIPVPITLCVDAGGDGQTVYQWYRDGEILARATNRCLNLPHAGAVEWVGSEDTAGIADDVVVKDGWAYVADETNGLVIMDVRDPRAPVSATRYPIPGDGVVGVTVVGNRAYAACRDQGLWVFDVSDPRVPLKLGSYPTSHSAIRTAVAGDFAYVAIYSGGLEIVNVRDPARMSTVRTVRGIGEAWDVVVSGGVAYVAGKAEGLVMIDVGNPSEAMVLGRYDTPGAAFGVEVSGNLAYVADGSNGLVVVEVSDPRKPVYVGRCAIAGTARHVEVVGQKAYVASWDQGLQVVDLTEPWAPLALSGYSTLGQSTRVQVSGSAAFVADQATGVQILETKAVVLAESGDYTVTVSNEAGSVTSDPAQVTVVVGPRIVREPEGSTNRVGEFVQLRVGALGREQLRYQWLKDGNAIPGGTSAVLALANLQPTDAGAYAVRVSNEVSNVLSVTVPLVVNEPPRIVQPPTDQLVIAGQRLELKVEATGTAPLSYQWRKGGSPIPGATGASYVVEIVSEGDEAVYGVAVSNVAGTDSADARVIVIEPPRIVVAPVGTSIVAGGRLELCVEAVSDEALAYGWQRDGQPLPGADQPCYTVAQVSEADEGAYTVFVSNVAGRVTSSVAEVIVIESPVVSTSPEGGVKSPPFTLCVEAVADGEMRYQWYRGGAVLVGATERCLTLPQYGQPERVSGVPIPGISSGVAVSEGYAFVAAETNGLVIVDIKDAAHPVPVGQFILPSDGASAVKLVGRIAYVAGRVDGLVAVDVGDRANPVLIGTFPTRHSAVRLAIDGHLAYVAIYSGGLEIVDVSNPAVMRRLGSLADVGNVWDVTVAAGMAYLATESTGLVVVDATTPAEARVIGRCDTDGSAYGVEVVGSLVYVSDWEKGVVVIDVSDPTRPVRVGTCSIPGNAKEVRVVKQMAYVAAWHRGIQLVDVTEAWAPRWVSGFDTTGQTAGLAVDGNNAYVADQWGGLQILDCSRTVMAESGDYSVSVSNEAGSVTSDPAQVTVVVGPRIVREPEGSTNRVGEFVQLRVGALGREQLRYQWLKDGNAIPGGTSAVLALANLQPTDAGAYAVRVSNEVSNVLSVTVPLVVNEPPRIVQPPTDQLVIAGQRLELKVEATGTAPLSYQWRKGTTAIPGATGSSYAVAQVSEADEAVYTVVVSNVAGSTNTSAHVVVVEPPRIVVSPAGANIVVGGRMELTVQAESDVVMTYQWFKDDQPIDGQTQSAYVVPAVSAADEGNYRVSVSNAAGSVTSTPPARVEVIEAPVILAQPAGGARTPPFEVCVTAAQEGTLAYQWYRGRDPLPGATNPCLALPQVKASREIRRIPTPALARGVDVAGEYVFVAAEQSGLLIYRLHGDPQSPPVKTLPWPEGGACAVRVIGARAYVAWREAGLIVVDVAKPEQASILGRHATKYSAVGVAVQGDVAYVATYTGGMEIVDVSDPVNMSPVGLLKDVGTIWNVQVNGEHAYLAAMRDGVVVVDVSDPANPGVVGRWATTGDVRGVEVVGSLLYVANGGSGLTVLEISDPTRPVLVGERDTPGMARDVRVIGQMAYVADWDRGVQLLDVAEPWAPALLPGLATQGQSAALAVTGTTVLIAAQANGLVIASKEGLLLAESGDYTVTVSNEAGSVTSQVAQVTVSVGPRIVRQPESVAANLGNPVEFRVAALGRTTLSYQWTKDGGDIPGATASTLRIQAAGQGDAGDYKVIVRNEMNSVESATVRLSINQPPEIVRVLAVPAEAEVVVDRTLELSVQAVGTPPLGYQWYRINEGAFQPIEGASNPMLRLERTAETDQGEYSVIVTNIAGSATNLPPTFVLVIEPPRIDVPPAGMVVAEGQSFLLEVVATSDKPMTYQWRKDGLDLPNATGSTYEVSAAAKSDEGSYSVVVSNVAGDVPTGSVAVEVFQRPRIVVQPVGAMRTPPFDLCVQAEGFGMLSYQWSLNGVSLTGATNTCMSVPQEGNPKLLSHWDAPGIASGVDVTPEGWVFVADGTGGLQILNARDPEAMTHQRTYPIEGEARDVKVLGTSAFVICADGWLEVLDVSNPEAPRRLARGRVATEAARLAVSGDHVFVAAYAEGLRIVEVSDPSAIQVVGEFKEGGAVVDVAIQDGRAYVALRENGMAILDVSAPAEMLWLGSCDTKETVLGIAVVGQLAYVADGAGGLVVVDVGDPTDPVIVGVSDTPGSAAAVKVSGNTAYVADWGSGLQVIDVTRPWRPTPLGSYDTPGDSTAVVVRAGTSFLADRAAGVWAIGLGSIRTAEDGDYQVEVTNDAGGTKSDVASVAIAVEPWIAAQPRGATNVLGTPVVLQARVLGTGPMAYQWTRDGTLLDGATSPVLRLPLLGPPLAMPGFDTAGTATAVAVSDDIAVVADETNGLVILDVAGTVPRELSHSPTPDAASGVVVAGGRAYVACRNAGLEIVDIRDPNHPIHLGSFKTTGTALRLALVGERAYVADYHGGLEILDVSNPQDIKRLGRLALGLAFDVAVQGVTAYVAVGGNGLATVDVSDPGNPAYLGGYDTPGLASGVDVEGDYAYVADGEAGLLAVNITDPWHPWRIGRLDTPGNANRVRVVGQTAYVADGSAGVQIVDVTKPWDMELLVHGSTPGTAFGLTLDGTRVYVACRDAGLQLLELQATLAAEPGIYTASVRNAVGSVSTAPAEVVILEPPLITRQPADVHLVADQMLTLRVETTGTPALTYQWKRNGEVLRGLAQATLSLPQVGTNRRIGEYDTPGSASGIALVRNLIYVADGTNGLEVLHLSDGTNITRMAHYLMAGSANDVQVVGQLAYVACRAAGVEIIDVSDPSAPIPLGTFDTPGDARRLAVAGDVVYVADDLGGLQILDAGNPRDIKLLSGLTMDGRASDVAVAHGKAYVAAGSGGVVILDVRDPIRPSMMSRLQTRGTAFGIMVEGDLAYVALGAAGLAVIDVSQPRDPVLVSGTDTSGSAVQVEVRDQLAYVADSGGGLQIIEISKPWAPTPLGRAPTGDESVDLAVSPSAVFVANRRAGVTAIARDTILAAPGVYSVEVTNVAGVAFSRGAVVTVGVAPWITVQPVSSTDTTALVLRPRIAHGNPGELSFQWFRNGLELPGETNLNVALPRSGALRRLGQLDTEGTASGLAISGSLALVADEGNGLVIVDVSNPAQPVEIGHYPTPDGASHVLLDGSIAYVACRNAGVEVVDLRNPRQPARVAHLATRGTAMRLALEGTTLYVAAYSAGLDIFDVAAPSAPRRIGSLGDIGTARDVAVAQGRAYVAMDGDGLVLVDVQAPAQPMVLGRYDTPGRTRGVKAASSNVYLADGEAGLLVLDVSDPGNPIPIGGWDSAGLAGQVAVLSHLVYVADGGNGVQVVDIAAPWMPEPIGDPSIVGEAADVVVIGSIVYVAARTAGLQILGPSATPEDSGEYHLRVSGPDGTASTAVATVDFSAPQVPFFIREIQVLGDGRVEVTCDSQVGRTYRLETASDVGGPWSEAAAATADHSETTLTHLPAANEPVRFYRVREE